MKTIGRPDGGKVPEGHYGVLSVNDQKEHRSLPEKRKRSFDRLWSVLRGRNAFFKRYRRKERIEIAF
jgi:hypothetical protein